ncbi:protein of unknown function [Pricia antarctica]|uniref:DUF4907 domain-containing protein n=1 Tax=Pricia antarctica TaxID=641691 RepID=A0A1G7C9H6_9FLAO|nr:DUF4907 domain-containing protein [Pricia antarctica]SDE36024.1 protein of unknown function [Pricia antarctica]
MEFIKGGIVLTLFTVLFFSVVSLFVPKSEPRVPRLFSEVIKLDEGYGYQISANGKLLIRQKHIPGLQGKIRFGNPKDARLIADLVIYKLTTGKSPEVGITELNELNIKTLNGSGF